ncbi:MAG: C1 family peptidase [Spirochaetaceae bacterium]|nr:C1 family peptidase [Spirochaetaceae bacterium]
MVKKLGIFGVIVMAAASLFAQDYPEYPLSAVLDETLYEGLPRKSPLVSRTYEVLPKAVSLKAYAPAPGDQAPYGTCVGWAAAYAARTISESMALGRRDRSEITANAFSPVYIYKSISNDPDCQDGASIPAALDMMKSRGAVKMLSNELTTDITKISLTSYADSRKYPIAGYVTLYQSHRPAGNLSQVTLVKKSLAAGKPVIIGMNTPPSFFEPGEVWRPRESPRNFYGGHAVCVVGYDDEKEGGAFEVLNSWGRKWGRAGFTWIPYNTFSRWVREAYEIIENLSAYEDAARFGGNARLELGGDGGFMAFALNKEGWYQSSEAWPSGTEFRVLLENRHPAYVYAFAAASGSPSLSRIFPPEDENISAILDYSDSAVAWPSERQWLRLDDTPGTDFIIILCAKEELDIRSIQNRVERARGSPRERVREALGRNALFVAAENAGPGGTGDAVQNGIAAAVHEAQKLPDIAFSAQSENIRSVFALFIAIEHVE